MGRNLKVFDTSEKLAEDLANQLKETVNKQNENFYLAVSGGSTPVIFFKRLAEQPFKNEIEWNKVHFFWCDERCVPPDDSESNFGMTKINLFDKIKIPEENIHRIKGESDPNEETVHYVNEIENNVHNGENTLPRFDWVMLGMGEDGHTASLFPNKNLLFIYSNIAGVAEHPQTSQKRISLTLDVLNNAKRITFVVTGKNKAKILSEILNGLPISKNYPSAQIKPTNGTIDWMIDKEASFYL
jgi:6-phosphogluconolactonase